MELRQHIGVLVKLITFAFLIWAFKKDWEKGYKPSVPLSVGVLFWCVFEAFYWVIVLLII
jgi:hypothetical protein